jgi:hypothetical protein
MNRKLRVRGFLPKVDLRVCAMSGQLAYKVAVCCFHSDMHDASQSGGCKVRRQSGSASCIFYSSALLYSLSESQECHLLDCRHTYPTRTFG